MDLQRRKGTIVKILEKSEAETLHTNEGGGAMRPLLGMEDHNRIGN